MHTTIACITLDGVNPKIPTTFNAKSELADVAADVWDVTRESPKRSSNNGKEEREKMGWGGD
jgi:hypothetical protein